MKQQRQSSISNIKTKLTGYKAQRNVACMAAVLAIGAISATSMYKINKLSNELELVYNVAESYRSQIEEYRSNLHHANVEIESLSISNAEMQSKLDAELTYFTPENLVVSKGSEATIFNSVPLDPTLQQYTWDLCNEYGISEYYPTIIAIMWHESNFNPNAISKTNDYGLMQINKGNISYLKEALGITDIMAPDQNICCGIYIFASIAKDYDDLHSILMCYNMGPDGLRRAHSKGIYSTAYSRSIAEKMDIILQDKYDPNLY